MQRITPEGGAPTHAYPDVSYQQCPPASIPYARSLARGALSAHPAGDVTAGTAAVDSGSADCRSDSAGPGDPCPRGRGLCEGLRQLRRHTCDRNRPARALPVILLERPWVVVTVPALVLCARL